METNRQMKPAKHPQDEWEEPVSCSFGHLLLPLLAGRSPWQGWACGFCKTLALENSCSLNGL